MTQLIKLLTVAFATIPAATADSSAAAIDIPAAKQPPLLDGKCRGEEWAGASTVQLPANVTIRFMHHEDSLYVCASGKEDDYAALDLYIHNKVTDVVHNLHISAQLGERAYAEGTWSDLLFWNIRDWTAFWVPFSGTEQTDSGIRPTFLRGSDREARVLRSKFPGDAWRMMIVVSAVTQGEDSMAEVSYPEGALEVDPSTWTTFAFSDQ